MARAGRPVWPPAQPVQAVSGRAAALAVLLTLLVASPVDAERQARRPAPAATVGLVVPSAAWRPSVARVAAAWNRAGLPARLVVSAGGSARADVTVLAGAVAARCGAGVLGCVTRGAGRRRMVLPATPGPIVAGAGDLTLVAHELGHLLGAGHRRAGCSVMHPRPSAAGCGAAGFARTQTAPGCRAHRNRGWRCPRTVVPLELCGPTAADVTAARRRAGLATAIRWSTPRCAGTAVARPSRRDEARLRNAGLRIAIPRSPELRRAARRHDAQLQRWCARQGVRRLPAVARRLCRVARG